MAIATGVIGFCIGFLVAWVVGKILASREFDQLLRQEEAKHQDIINKFNDVLYDKDDAIEDLKTQLHKLMKEKQ